jgi:hypothetical protein
LKKTCSSSPCTYASTYSEGTYNYYAVAEDTALKTKTSTIKTLTVSSSTPKPPLDLTKLHGVDIQDRVLRDPQIIPHDLRAVQGNISKAKLYNWNVIRLPVNWEAYEKNPTNLKTQAKHWAREGEKAGIYIFFTNFHFETTTHWPREVAKSGKGFGKVTDSYYPDHYIGTSQEKYEDNPEVEAFWDDFFARYVRDPDSGCNTLTECKAVAKNFDAWDAQADYFTDVIKAVEMDGDDDGDGFSDNPFLLGYEIMNEPHTFDTRSNTNEVTHYDDLGNYHTYMASRITAVTKKAIIFTRDVPPRGNRPASCPYKIIPRLPAGKTNLIMYWPHLYNIPNAQDAFNGGALGNANGQIQNFENVMKHWREIGVCRDPDEEVGTCILNPTSGQMKPCTSSGRVKFNGVGSNPSIIIGMGEYATQDNQICKADLDDPDEGKKMMEAFVCTWRNRDSAQKDWPHAYWATNSPGYGNQLMTGNGGLTIFGQRYVDAIDKYYAPSYTGGSCPVPSVRGPFDEAGCKDTNPNTICPNVDPDTGCPKP